MNHLLLPHLFKEELYYFGTPVVVVLSRPWESHSAEEQALLQRILGSVRLDLTRVRIVIRPALALDSLTFFSPARVLIFGSSVKEEIALYVETPALGFSVIRADDLNALDDQKKKNLWIALRQMFGI